MTATPLPRANLVTTGLRRRHLWAPRRSLGEFLEMPGLHVSLPQAQCLFALDADTCQTLLDTLVRARRV